ncbi:hypothetical protein RM697_10535 [Ichthyenterobacterium sp. W332]|uniref:Lipoprotein n=1 Tax=Microcosmobacter mediterraneus TaxID=3075607 RepID=A0ABU2YLQ4_9FLAO|nr:hypothetical protein [Ichthyenterobacterium sp. W332]MDT0559088.1 hypothetical protein [Ichthyenterobacterium sp. W332]
MKHILSILALLFVLTSCNFTEEITFKEDGSGEFVMTYDMAGVMEKMKEMGMDSSSEEKEPEKMDSIIYFKDIFEERADSIAKLSKDEQQRLKALESFVMKMRMDEAEGIFDIGIGTSFDNFNDLPELIKRLDEAKNMNSQGAGQMSQINNTAVAKATENSLEMVDFKYDGKSFSRSFKDDIERSEDDLKALKEEMEQMGEAKDVFESMSYTLVYTFPKKIKSVSNNKAIVDEDGKTVRLKMNFMEMIKSPELMNLDVVLED